MKKLLLFIGIVVVLPGCQLFPRWIAVPAYYPEIQKPKLHGKIVLITEAEEKTMDMQQQRDIWEGNCILLHEYVEEMEAAVDAYNAEARKRNAAVSLIGKPPR